MLVDAGPASCLAIGGRSRVADPVIAGRGTVCRMPGKINLAEAFGRIDEYYSPRIAGEVNDFQVKFVKLRGGFVSRRLEQAS